MRGDGRVEIGHNFRWYQDRREQPHGVTTIF